MDSQRSTKEDSEAIREGCTHFGVLVSPRMICDPVASRGISRIQA